jgi:hypothetical protein
MNWLISYPRSGNTWVRYCVEFLSKRPTTGPSQHYKGTIDKPLTTFRFAKIKADLAKPSILKKGHSFPPNISGDDKVILLLRNYKESIIRHLKSGKSIRNIKKWEEQKQWYADLILTYDKITSPKLLIYYEDLIQNAAAGGPSAVKLAARTLESVVDFLEIPNHGLKRFVSDIEGHRALSIKIYRQQFPSMTKGKSVIFHSKKFDKDKLKDLDQFMRDKLADKYDEYLGRYKG